MPHWWFFSLSIYNFYEIVTIEKFKCSERQNIVYASKQWNKPISVRRVIANVTSPITHLKLQVSLVKKQNHFN